MGWNAPDDTIGGGDEKYGNMEIWKYGNMEIWKHGNMEIWVYGKMEIWKNRNMEIWKFNVEGDEMTA